MTNMLLAAVVVASLPNPALTPGAGRPMSKATLCSVHWGTDRRHVTTAMKKQVAAAYGLPWADRGKVEFDHLIPRELGGSDSTLNLWPQPWVFAHRKDRVENRLHVLVCLGRLPLAQAQAEIVADWPAAYRRYVTPR